MLHCGWISSQPVGEFRGVQVGIYYWWYSSTSLVCTRWFHKYNKATPKQRRMFWFHSWTIAINRVTLLIFAYVNGLDTVRCCEKFSKFWGSPELKSSTNLVLVIIFVSAPEKWNHANKDCAGRHQSPVNIVTRKVLKDERLTPLRFENYQQIFRGSIKNNGHSGELTVSLLQKLWTSLVHTLCSVCVHYSSGWSSSHQLCLRWRSARHL